MFKIGLTSISFRNLSADEIIKACQKAGLEGIEWGGDVHVPHGDLKTADIIREKTLEAGLEVSSYGSYYRMGVSEEQGLSFKSVLESAKVLEAPIIRVWAGNRNMEEYTEEEIDHISKDALRIADMSADEGIGISFEYHENTLTNSNENALKFAERIKHPNLKFYWQPPNKQTVEYRISGLEELLKRELVTNIHVFHWTFDEQGKTRHLLEEGREVWKKYIDILKKYGGERYLLFEFFKDNSVDNFFKDVEVLKELV